MKRELDEQLLLQENECFSDTPGISENNRERGFHPAFQDTETGNIYLSRFANGRPSPVHVLAGLPNELVTRYSASGEVCAVSPTVISGFVLDGRFYTRAEVIELSETRH